MKIGTVNSYVDITLNTDYKYSRSSRLKQLIVRTRNGKLQCFTPDNNYHKFIVPLSDVNSSTKSLINSWWAVGTNLRLYEDSDKTDYYNVRVTGKKSPFSQWAKMEMPDKFNGKMMLEEI